MAEQHTDISKIHVDSVTFGPLLGGSQCQRSRLIFPPWCCGACDAQWKWKATIGFSSSAPVTATMIFTIDQSDLALLFFVKVKISANLRGWSIGLRESSKTPFSENTDRISFFLARVPLLFIRHPLVWLRQMGHVLSLQSASLLLHSLLMLSYHRRTRCQQPSGLCWPPYICTPSHQQAFLHTHKGSSTITSTPLNQRLWLEDTGLLSLERTLCQIQRELWPKKNQKVGFHIWAFL